MSSIQKNTTLLLITAILALPVSCRNTRPSCVTPSWIIHVPSQWHLVEQGSKSSTLSYALYKRDPFTDKKGNKIVPSCMITSEDHPDTIDLGTCVLERQSSIIASMQSRGYTLTRFRKDIQHEIKTAFRINDIISLSYEYQYENNLRPFLVITVFARKRGNLINVSIESTADTYDYLRREIYQIVSSIR